MDRITTAAGIAVSYERRGSGAALVLVHGAFSDHRTNWEFVRPLFDRTFTTYAMARRGRGETDATTGHRLLDEIEDAIALLRSIGEPVFLLGHSYGAHVALGAAAAVPDAVRRLVLYEPPRPELISGDTLTRLVELAEAELWEDLALEFFRDTLLVPERELGELRESPLWAPIVADAPASFGDLCALSGYRFEPERFRALPMPVLLQTGAESPRDLYLTDALAAVLPDARPDELAGQAHEAMTTAPELYADSVARFLQDDQPR